jgi:hypothetical protein
MGSSEQGKLVSKGNWCQQKTRFCHLPEETFDFLGYTLGRNYDCRTGESYLGPWDHDPRRRRSTGSVARSMS